VAPRYSRNFTLLSTASVVSGLGAQGALIASAFAVLDSGGDSGDVGLVATARTVPLVLFLLVGGALADHIPRHRVMVGANALNCVSQGLFAVLVLLGHPQVWEMMALSALGGTGQALFSPASEGMVMSSVDAVGAGRAFAVYRIAVNSATIGGAALGGALVAVVGPGWVLAADAAAFLVSGSLRSFLDLGGVAEHGRTGSVAGDLRDGWREFAARSWLWCVVGACGVINAVEFAAVSVYGPLIARDHFGGAGAWGTVSAASGAGTLLGALVMTRWQPRRPLLMGMLGFFPLTLLFFGLASLWPVAVLAAAMCAAGVSLEVFGVAWMTALRQEIPEEKLSRVSSYDWLGSIGLMPVGGALAGPAQHAFGLGPTLWGSGGLVALLTGATLLVPGVRRLRVRDGGVVAGGAPSADAEGAVGRAG
jgi:MFS family permease